MADDQNQDADENARNQAALAAYDDQQRKMRVNYAAFVEPRPCLFSGVSGDHGTRAYIFVNTWKPLGQTGSI